MTTSDGPMDATDVFSAVAADAVSFVKYEPLLLQLFSEPPGQWRSLLELDSGDAAAELLKERGPVPMGIEVAWLEWPSTGNSEGFSLVVFCSTKLRFARTAVFNKRHLLKKHDAASSLEG